jgi:hypothetical protein
VVTIPVGLEDREAAVQGASALGERALLTKAITAVVVVGPTVVAVVAGPVPLVRVLQVARASLGTDLT